MSILVPIFLRGRWYYEGRFEGKMNLFTWELNFTGMDMKSMIFKRTSLFFLLMVTIFSTAALFGQTFGEITGQVTRSTYQLRRHHHDYRRYATAATWPEVFVLSFNCPTIDSEGS